MGNTDEDFGSRLRTARVAKGLEPGEAARRMGIAYPTLMNHEAGQRGARRRAADYARIYGVNLVWLSTGTGTMKGPDPLTSAISELDGEDRRQVEDFVRFLQEKKRA